jgi:hypothetical protein
MYQDVVLINYSLNTNTPEVKTVKARPFNRIVINSDGDVTSYTILFEGEDGMYYTQEIVCYTEPFRALFSTTCFQSFDDAFLVLSAFNNTLKRSDFD